MMFVRTLNCCAIKNSNILFTKMLSTSAGVSVISPRHYGKNFRMPKIDGKLNLELMNSHPNDGSIVFDPIDHSYSIKEKKINTSVTQFVSQFFSSFDSDLIIDKMMNGRNWPRPGYTNKDGSPHTAEQIKEKWDNISLNARNRGTWLHHNIEMYFNGAPYATDIPELQQFLNFSNDIIMNEQITPFRTEWKIGSDALNIAGTVDFVGKKTDGTFALFDWKRMKDVHGSLNNAYGERAKAPLFDYDDCDGVKYFLQLNMYKYILEKYYNIEVSSMHLVSLHPAQENYALINVPVMDIEVETILTSKQLL